MPSPETESDKTTRFFDFSSADLMPVAWYHDLSDRPEVCHPVMEMGGGTAFNLQGLFSVKAVFCSRGDGVSDSCIASSRQSPSPHLP